MIAVEPLPQIFANLQANIRRNGAGKVEPVLGAIATTAAPILYLAFDPRHSGVSRIVEAQSGSVATAVISAVKLDSLFAEPPCAIVAKIDVEGSEVDVLSTLRSSRIYDSIEEIIIEVSEDNLGTDGREQLLHALAREGFEEHSRKGPPRHYDAWFRRGGIARATASPSWFPSLEQ